MGGNALSVPGMRLPEVAYNRVMRVVAKQLEFLLPSGVRFHFIRSYRSKASFGDMDILVESYQQFDPRGFQLVLGATEMVRNGDVTSFGVPITLKEELTDSSVETSGLFQIDIIKMAPEAFDFACKYFAFNDLGNLMGRIAHKQGFKYGHDGLWYVLRDPDDSSRVVAELLVSRDHTRVVEFLGYDSETWQAKWNNGFEDLEDIFQFVSSTPLFNSKIYLLENRNHHARVRDKKRSTYMSFLKWCEDKTFFHNFKWEDDKEYLRGIFLQNAFAYWPEFEAAYESALRKHAMRKEGKEKYNGTRVSELTGLSGKELGAFMADFKLPWFYDDHFWHWVSVVTQEDVDKAILTGWKRRYGKKP